jgi:diguanylate cyclase (GGDEF)-like protein
LSHATALVQKMPKQSSLSNKQLMSVIETQTAIAKLGVDLHAVMTLVANQIQKLVISATGTIVELAEDDEMVYRAVSNKAEHLLGLRLPLNKSLSGLCISQKTTLYCRDSETDARVNREACQRVGLRSMAVVPLFYEQQVIGVIKIYSDQINAFHEKDLSLLGLMSDLIAAAMYHATKFSDQELYKLATRDHLTGLANRALFLDSLRLKLQEAKQFKEQLAVLIVDMDGLKLINDQFGHRYGDTALIEIAKRLSQNIRKNDLVARLGGDEFAIILPSVENYDVAKQMTVRLVDACSQPFSFENIYLKIGASIGLAIYPHDSLELQQLIDVADLNMYGEKKKRKLSLS